MLLVVDLDVDLRKIDKLHEKQYFLNVLVIWYQLSSRLNFLQPNNIRFIPYFSKISKLNKLYS